MSVAKTLTKANSIKRGHITHLVIFALLSLFGALLVAGCKGGGATASSTTTTNTTTKTATASSTTKSSTSSTALVWSPNVDCSVCHAAQVKSFTDNTLLASKHAAVSNKCLGCHDLSILQAAHKNFSPTTSVPPQTFPQSFCLKCHGTYAALIVLTKSSKAFLKPDGTAVNPHDTHVGPTDCSNCHSIHGVSAGIDYCYSCHHAKVLECGTCHP
jgi:hypothetical protein